MSQIPNQLRDILEDADQATLEATIEFAEAQLAEPSSEPEEGSQNLPTEPPDEFEGDAEAWREAVEDSDAPSRATLTTKRINGNQYLYWQWSEGGTTKSEYIAPKNPST
ncbi:hypothetical protein PNP59_08595 [Halobacterium salinarum]|uniref:hypothetical protein n=1 Tax=Halobacterium salinarum TaxID=2242 RepID=UPI0025538AA3|nr:hypothetical protein [Halobacterium salinarum]MDL0130991.1 hypothetical protein [Halobacterium salinarum]